ncbi:MAG: glycosyltransferase N-terminal domain-containing protein [Candidatus Cloacimonadota bacterium]|nr:glycosyltransferase N-terminal domain-containing protein [Candidatus Cloacimonadota bacterium]
MIVYNILVVIVAAISLPYILIRFKGKERKQRLGFIGKPFSQKTIWIHAASVGEVNAAKDLIKKIHNNQQVVVTTMTATGQKIASSLPVKTFFLPFDCILMMLRAYKRLQPKAIVLVETEFWPNMLWIAKLKKIPVFVVNGRLSDKSFRNYLRTSFFWKTPWKAIKAVSAQTKLDMEKFKKLDFSDVKNNGNLKFNIQLPFYHKKELRNEYGYSEKDFIVVWGSSRPGEEKLLRSIFASLEEKITDLCLIVVPRHLNRMSEIKEIFPDFGLFSRENRKSKHIIVDEMGQLAKLYSIADLAIVGGSFYDFGGHNPLEPAFYGIPIIMGPYYSSCQDSVNKLQKNEAIVISDPKNLKNDIISLFYNEEIRKKLGKRAKKTMQENSDNLQNTYNFLKERLQNV